MTPSAEPVKIAGSGPNYRLSLVLDSKRADAADYDSMRQPATFTVSLTHALDAPNVLTGGFDILAGLHTQVAIIVSQFVSKEEIEELAMEKRRCR